MKRMQAVRCLLHLPRQCTVNLDWFDASFAGAGIWDNWFTVTEIGLGDAYAPFCTKLIYDRSLCIDARATAHGRNAWLFLKSLSWLCWLFIHSFGADFRDFFFANWPPATCLNYEAKIPQMHWKLWSGLGPLLQTCRVLRPRPRKTWIPWVSMQWTRKMMDTQSKGTEQPQSTGFPWFSICWFKHL